ncbi:alpha/beta fold hydrolase [Actinokineospora enzanensis]|uniref:alpha/beta fold hydrolase n=1 Tax=Actinokineospora enzanensis TaxID=155975 RepID=UPI000367CAE0|nr:alpha/beta fold hydrolase [Actinokineospora enzanensis]
MPEETGDYAIANGIRLWYRDEGDPDGEPLVLIMGLNSQLILWPEEFVTALGERGFRVIRFDNRDCGLSEKIDMRAQEEATLARPAYLLTDLAADTVGLLDHLEVQSAHVVGASMGGMVAQLVAIHHAERVRTLCSIMSTTGNRLVGGPSAEAALALLEPTPPDRDDAIEHIANIYRIIGSKTHAETERERRLQLAAASYDRSFHPAGARRQFTAISVAANRTADLRELSVPTQVIHGAEDTLINVTGGRATHDAIPDSTYLELPDMGHDLPEPLWPRLIQAIADNATTNR